MRTLIAAALLLASFVPVVAADQPAPVAELQCFRDEIAPTIRGYRLPPVPRLGPEHCIVRTR